MSKSWPQESQFQCNAALLCARGRVLFEVASLVTDE